MILISIGLNPNVADAIKPASDALENNKPHENGIEHNENGEKDHMEEEPKPPRTVKKQYISIHNFDSNISMRLSYCYLN